MLSTILWIIGGIIVLGILFSIAKIFFVVMGVKKVLNIVRDEVEHLPNDYHGVRKEVQNENATVGSIAKSTAKTAAKVGWRWFKRI